MASQFEASAPFLCDIPVAFAGGFFVAVLRKVRDIPLAPASSVGSDAALGNEAPAFCSQTETADRSAIADGNQDDSGNKEVHQGAAQEDATCSVEENRGSLHFEQVQLDMAGLDWQTEVLERQHQQLLFQQERLLKQREHLGGELGGPELKFGASASVSSNYQKRLASSVPLPITRSVLDQTVELAFRTLDLPDGMLKCSGSTPGLQALCRRLCSLLYFRHKTSDSSVAVVRDCSQADQLSEESSDRRPRRLFFVSEGVKRLVESVGASRYKIINGGCLAFQARCKGVYRISYGGAQWLAPFYDSAVRLGAATGDTRSQVVERHVFHIPCKLLYKLVATEHDQRRVDIRKIKDDDPFGETVARETSEGPLLFLAQVPNPLGDTGCSTAKIAVSYGAVVGL